MENPALGPGLGSDGGLSGIGTETGFISMDGGEAAIRGDEMISGGEAAGGDMAGGATGGGVDGRGAAAAGRGAGEGPLSNGGGGKSKKREGEHEHGTCGRHSSKKEEKERLKRGRKVEEDDYIQWGRRETL
ncbi:glycine-rich cell wall structural protein 1.0-like [Cucurbita pepo subsp. pepo]|uniref:glycine-rich cell wall structural protein 1.0-like n=1 Tax=Cucurbita pepo subsp. pepo TaxID=3664 RepID=UPI000C9DA1A7|nr:glycine-rich cell wall structural protein 1.0-like [Cucurbita pepo subsp. pepo]